MIDKKKAPVTAVSVTGANEEFEAPSSTMITDKQRRFAKEAESWVSENVGAWTHMVNAAREYAHRGHRFGMQELAEQVRRKDYTDRNGQPTKLNNNHVAPLARLLMIEVPECRKLMERRTSAYDELLG